MKRLLLLVTVVLLLVLPATDSQALCKKCGYDFHGCISCLDTSYNASVLCTISNPDDFPICDLQGQCDGQLGDENCTTPSGCRENIAEDRRVPNLPYRSRDWKLVSVTLKRATAGRSSL
jgi:hypothetical protein